ncbi:hypothetical protein [Acanthopleuribacter pedis]|uniref:Uncharacterized protein n=1 Tax=Acanthopleuribacter pedis TaxID=442870 RepID=A0A8J7QLF0_9BACT|nr:hypothetical protein [Acanthopleuribacter pedis]MBO1323276.1 hypothetical protein [Acanthopleuribacter pedis]
MKPVCLLLVTCSLCAFGGVVVPVAVPDVAHKTMEEDFPLSLYVDYGSHEPVFHPTSVSVNLPMIEVLQHRRAYGAVDAGETLLPYAPLPADARMLGALDIDHDGEGVYWMVDGGPRVFFRDTERGIERQWRLWGHLNLSEIATSPGSDKVWAYDACRGHLLLFDKRMPWCFTRYQFDRPMDITGLVVDENELYLLDSSEDGQVIFQFEIGRFSLEYQQSWRVLGFEDVLITDLALVPEGGFLIATTDPELSLVLIEDKQTEPESPIAHAGELAVVDQIALPEDVKQPSGLYRDALGRWFISTDQAEIFELDAGFGSVGRFEVTYENVACNQGCTEAVSGTGDSLHILTDEGYVARYQRDGTGFQYREEFSTAYQGSSGEDLVFSGLSYRPDTQTFYLLSDAPDADQADMLLEVDASFNELSRKTLSYSGELSGSLFEYDAAGVQYHNGKIYALSDLYNTLLEINLDGEIQRAFAIDREVLREPSDLFIHEGLIYMVGDHENEEPTPPVTVFALPQ